MWAYPDPGYWDTMSCENSQAPMTRVASDPKTEQPDPNRRESGVFLSPQHSRETDPGHLLATRRGPLESGYRSGLSESSVLSHDPSPRMAHFFVPDHESDEHDDASETLLLDSGAHSDPVSDDRQEQDTDDDLEECPSPSARSAPVAIPAVSLHEAQGSMLRLMEATPPRTYLSRGAPAPEEYHGQYRHSTGCLSISPAMVAALGRLRDAQTADCVRQGLRVTSGRLHASNSRASMAQRRQSDAPLPFLELTTDRSLPEPSPVSRTALSRDRSRSAPDICSVRVQKQCAQELRKISDEFFADFHTTARQSRTRTQSQSVEQHCLDSSPARLPASYPGSRPREHSSSWWQSIIQNIAPQHLRRPSLPAGILASHHEQPESSSPEPEERM